jgi:hypothetical protein
MGKNALFLAELEAQAKEFFDDSYAFVSRNVNGDGIVFSVKQGLKCCSLKFSGLEIHHVKNPLGFIRMKLEMALQTFENRGVTNGT